MNISQQLALLTNIKSDIKQAIEDKNVTVQDNTPFSSYAGLIDTIQTGGNNVAVIQKDNAERECESIIIGRIPTGINVTNTGGVTISTDYIASGFANNKYLLLPENFNPQSNIWEVNFKIKTGSNITTDQYILGSTTTNLDPLGTRIKDKHFGINLCSNGAYINGGQLGTYTVLANTIYYIRIKFTGTEYTFEYSLDGQTYVTDITLQSSLILDVANVAIGIQSGSASIIQELPFLGSVYLSDCYININGQKWWEAITVHEEEIL